MPSPSQDSTEAIFLFSGDQIAREMLYPEFEAILDGFVPVPDYAGQSAKAVFATIDHQLNIQALVFFVIDFDARGMADPRWNLPLHQLLEQASRGPDLGAGPIRLVCFSQCPVAWQQNALWDPQMEPGSNSFVLLRKSVRRNRLGLIVRGPDPEEVARREAHKAREVKRAQQARESRERASTQQLKRQLHEHYSQEMRDRLAGVLKDQRLRITTLNNQHRRQVEELQQDHQRRLQAYRDKVRQLQEQNADFYERLEEAKERTDAQVQKIEAMREYFTHKLEAAHADDSLQLQALQENYEMELAARVHSATSELDERLEMREMELLYRHQQEASLKEEIARLRRENQELLGQGGGQLLGKLDRAGISFVAFHPGVGQLTVPVSEVAGYLEDPDAFAAGAIGVLPELYRRWLKHHASPLCTARLGSGQVCGCSLPKVARPSDFQPGESDRCPEHKMVVNQRLAQP